MKMEKVCDSSRFAVIGGDQISFGQVKFEVPIEYRSENINQEAKYMILDFRAQKAGYINLRDISIQMLFKVEDWMKIISGVSGNREEKISMIQL